MFLSPDAPVLRWYVFSERPRYIMPGFADLCERVAELWREKREEIAAQNAEVQKAFERTRRAAPASASTPPRLARSSIR